MQFKALLLRIAYKFALIYWFIFRPTTVGTRCAIIHDNKVLLIRHTYTSQDKYFIPGGGVKKGEAIKDTIVRELKEEVNLLISSQKLKLITVLQSNIEYKNDFSFMFALDNLTDEDVNGVKLNDKSEIAEIRWFDLNNLPSNLSKMTEITLNRYKELRRDDAESDDILLDYVEFKV